MIAEIKTEFMRITVETIGDRVTLDVSGEGFASLTADETDRLVVALSRARVAIRAPRLPS
jgi:hypothetical protein